ncbi:MAG: archaeosine biosynthesis radical SAM protein RaSEA [Candidatus Thorarchaeota archaeon]
MNEELTNLAAHIQQFSLRSRGTSIDQRRKRDPKRPAASWVTTARIGYDTGTAISIVLSTIGCSYARGPLGGCTMCSYLLDGTSEHVSTEDLVTQFETAMSKVADATSSLSVKIYTSGSFLDPAEVPPEARQKILLHLAADDRVTQVVLESRPEYVTEEVMSEIHEILGNRDVEIGIGLESSNDTVRLMCINKGFTLDDFERSVMIARRYGIGTRAYVLVKAPFLTERDALFDALDTMTTAARLGVTTISVNPIDIQRYTLVERLWKNGQYRPPWLWTVVQVLRQARREIPANVIILCDPVAAGKQRGTHNCGKCDKALVSAIRKFSLTQDSRDLEGLTCDCRAEWEHALAHEDLSLIIHGR